MIKKPTMKNFKNKTTYLKMKHESNYTVINNEIINNSKLNPIAKIIMITLLSKSDNYVVNTTYLKNEIGVGDDKFYSAMKTLIDLGYINKKKIQGGVHWTINECPNPMKENTENETSEDIIIPEIEVKETISSPTKKEEEVKKESNPTDIELIKDFNDYIEGANFQNVNQYINEGVLKIFDKDEIIYIIRNINLINTTIKRNEITSSLMKIIYPTTAAAN